MKSITKSLIPQETIRKMVKKAFPDCVVTEIRELTEGMFNAAYRISGTGALENGVILKAGPMEGVKTLTYEKEILRSEVSVYGLLAQKDVPAPRVYAWDYSHSLVPCDYFFMSEVPGILWKNAEPERLARSRPKLMQQLGRIHAAIHSIPGAWFGYLKEDPRFRFGTWYEAFTAMVGDILYDGKADGRELPYTEIEQTVLKHRAALEQVKQPRLVDFDLWAGNVLLREAGDGYEISGILDFERSFFGDPYADFTSSVMIFDDVGNEPEFRDGYGTPILLDEAAQIRMNLYRLYMALIMYVETYRYDEQYAAAAREGCLKMIRKLLQKLNG